MRCKCNSQTFCVRSLPLISVPTCNSLGGLVHCSTRGESLFTTSNLAFARGLILGATRLELVCNGLLASLLRLGPVDCLHENALVLEHVTLALQVHLVVHVLVDLLRLAILLEQAAKHTVTAKPEHLGREASLTSTPALTIAGVTSEPLGSETSKSARTGMDLRTSQVYYKVSLDVHDLLKRAAGSERKSTLEPAGARRTFCGLRMTKPSLTNLRMFWREFAMLISLIYRCEGEVGWVSENARAEREGAQRKH